MLFQTYNVIPLTSDENIKKLPEFLTQEQRNKGDKQWCFQNSTHAYNVMKYGKVVDEVLFNKQQYCNMVMLGNAKQKYTGCTTKAYKDTLSRFPITNTETFYIIQMFDNGKHVDSCIVDIDTTGHYHHTYGKNQGYEGWPKGIPEGYKLFIKYVQYPFYHPTEVTNENITINKGKLCINDCTVGDDAYYTNKTKMFVMNDNTLEIHLPFNVIDVSKFAKKINSYHASSIKFIGDNEQLINNCKVVVIDIDRLIDHSIIMKDGNLWIIDETIPLYPNTLVKFKQKAFKNEQ